APLFWSARAPRLPPEEQSEPAGCLWRLHVRQFSTRGSHGPTLPGNAFPRPRCGAMIDPDFDPGEPWRDGLLAGIVILVAGAHLALWFARVLIHPLERLLS